MKINKIKEKVEKFGLKKSIDTIQVAIYKNNEIYYLSNRQASSKLIFELASVSKLITAFAILIACDEKKISLSTKLSNVFNNHINVHRNKVDIQINELLTHTSGFPNLPIELIDIIKTNEANPYSTLDKNIIFNYLEKDTIIQKKEYRYSNFGYGLLGLIIEEVYQCSLDDFLQTKIFQPIGMINTSLNKPLLTNGAQITQGYNFKNQITPIWEDYCLAGGGAVLSTTTDFIKFLSFYFIDNMYNKILNTMLVPYNKKMAIGWHRQNFILSILGAGSYLWHNGQVGGCSSFTAISKKENSAFIILANKGISIDELGIEIMSYLN